MSKQLTASLSEYLNSLGDAVDSIIPAIKDQIDIEAADYEETVRKGIPVRDINGGTMRDTFRKIKIEDSNVYGWEIGWHEDTYPNGDRIESAAYINNYGTAQTPGTFFITKGERKLKGMSDRIKMRVNNELEKVGKE